MNTMNWLIQTSEPGTLPIAVSEYLLNDMGLFIKCELRMPKDGPLNAIYGFRVGYRVVKGTDYRMALTYRNAILWHKITSVVEEELGTVVIYGNTEDVISIQFDLASRNLVVQFIEEKRRKYPPVIAADPAAVVWMCWRDDEDWEDITMPLNEMVNLELKGARYIDEDVLEETVLDERTIDRLAVEDAVIYIHLEASERPKFCIKCGASLPTDGNFCKNCGTRYM